MASDDALISVEVGHQIDVIRFGATLGVNVNPHLTRISKKAREILLRTEYIDTKKLMNEIIKEISAEMQEELGDYIGDLEDDLKPFVAQEVAFQYAVVKDSVGKGVAIKRPTIKATTALINSKPMVLNGKAISVSDRLGGYTGNQIQSVADVITAGWADGLTTRQISQNITGTKQIKGVMQQSQNSAYAMTRDVTSHISAQSKAKVGQENSDIIVGEKMIVTLDSKTSPICQKIGSEDGGGKEYYYDTDGRSFPRPPFHYNCLFGDSLITSAYGISSVSKRRYKGVKVTITTASGNKLSVTPNHPVLTSVGWVAAEKVNLSHKLVLQSLAKGVTDINGNDNGVYPTVEDVFESFGSSGEVSTSEVPLSSPDFHGDAIDKEVAIIKSKRLLLGEAIANASKEISKLTLKSGYGGCVSFSSNSALDFLAVGSNSTFGSGVGCLRELGDVFTGSVVHSGLLLLRSASSFDSESTENPSYNRRGDGELLGYSTKTNSIIEKGEHFGFVGFRENYNPLVGSSDSSELHLFADERFADTELLCDNPDTYAGGVELCDVVDVAFAKVDSSHVYNLETVDHCYSANGIITHNCRTTTSYIMADEYREISDEDQTRPQVVDGKATQVKATKGWMDMAKANPTLARQSLGKSRAAILDTMSADEFTKIAYNRMGQTITLEQMAQNNAKANSVLNP